MNEAIPCRFCGELSCYCCAECGNNVIDGHSPLCPQARRSATNTTANAGAGDALGDALTAEQRQLVSECADDAGIGNEPELVGIIRDLAGRLTAAQRERDEFPAFTAEEYNAMRIAVEMLSTTIGAGPLLDTLRTAAEKLRTTQPKRTQATPE